MQEEVKSVPLSVIIKKEKYTPVYLPKPAEEILITTSNVNRPSLMFSGYTESFDNTRLQFIGYMESGYLKSMTEEERYRAVDTLLSAKPPAIIFTRDQKPLGAFLELAEKYGVAILTTHETTSLASSSVSYFLSEQLVPVLVKHGVLVEVYGEGVLIMGDSGVGKSEAALELITRGHRLIADDVVEIRKINNQTISGMSPENIRHYIEVRGVGIIDVRRLFGVGAVKYRQKIHMAVELENWDSDKVYNVIGLEEEKIDILGVKIPYMLVPIKPGRNVATIIEVAARSNREKKMGFNAAKELMDKLDKEFS